jgi:hypothetical protein
VERKKAADLAYAEGYRLGSASRDAEIADLLEANRIACEDLVEQQNLRVKYAGQIDESVAALEAVIPEVAGGNAGLIAYNKCKAALAKVRKPTFFEAGRQSVIEGCDDGTIDWRGENEV